MKESKLHIFIIAEATPRAKAIGQILNEGFKQATLDIVSGTDLTNGLKPNSSQQGTLICLLDLMSTDESSIMLIRRVKDHFPFSKIIAMHIYRSDALVKPLYELGIDGYLFCEPSRTELISAVNSVIRGEKYRPDFLSYS